MTSSVRPYSHRHFVAYIRITDYLCTPDPETRLTKAIGIFTKQASISEVTTKISTAVSESLSKQQKEFFLRQQLDAIQRELSNLTGDKSGDFNDEERGDADELADLKRKIDAMTEGSEHRRMAVREYRRLKRIPQGSVEQGVIRSYVRASSTHMDPS
jgi:ATP-dependent Lon protease